MHPKALEGFQLTKQWYEDNPGKHPLKKTEMRVANFVHSRRSEKRDNKLSDNDIRELETIPGWDWDAPHKASERIATSLTPIDDTFNPLCTTRQMQLEWIAGFLAGDGCIQVTSSYINVHYMQSEKGIANMQYIQRLEGGCIRVGAKAKETHQQGFVLDMDYDTSVKHLENLRDVMTHKKRQLEIALEFPRNMYAHPTSQREEIRDKRRVLVEESRQLKRIYDEDIDDAKVTLNFMGGFFAAEGSVSLTRRGLPVIVIAQKSPKMLESVRRFWGFGYVGCRGYWGTNTRYDAEIFARAMIGRSGCKDAVLRVIIDYIDEYNAESRKRGRSWMSEERITHYRELLVSLNAICTQKLKPTIPSLLRVKEAQTGLPVGLSTLGTGGFKYRVAGKIVRLDRETGVTCREDAIQIYEKHLAGIADMRAVKIHDAVHRFTRM